MTDEREAQEALALAHRMGRPAARAARRWVRRYLFVMGVATGCAVIGSGLLTDRGSVWLRAVVTGLLWAVLFGAALALLGAQQVRAMPARRQVLVIVVVSAVVVGATMGIGPDIPAAYPIGAALTFLVWALGALWVGTQPPTGGP